MGRSELLQGLRLMKFEMILERCVARELSQIEAAEILGVTERTFRRWRDRYEEEGLDGLYDRRLGQASGSGFLSMRWKKCSPFTASAIEVSRSNTSTRSW